MVLPSTSVLVAFVRAAELGQLRAAAKQLHLTESAISHQISRLEKLLDVSLLVRASNGVSLTPTGQVLFKAAAPALHSIASAADQIRRRSHLRVSITLPHAFAALWLAPRLDRIAEDLPSIDLHLVPTQRLVDLRSEEIDIAIRMGGGNWRDCESVPFCNEVITPVCSPQTAVKVRRLGWNKFAENARFIVNTLHADEWDKWCDAFGQRAPLSRQCNVLPSFDIAANAAVAGTGIAMGRTPLVDVLEKAGLLVRPFPSMLLKTTSYHLVWPSGASKKGAHRELLEWLRSEMGEKQSH